MNEFACPLSVTIVYTARIEMINNTVLLYTISAPEKDRLQYWLYERSCGYRNIAHTFVGFYALPERYVFIRVKDIARLTLQCDYLASSDRITEYYDNFHVVPEANRTIECLDEDCQQDPELLDFLLDNFYPEIIIQLHGRKDPLVYVGIDEKDNSLRLLLSEVSLHNLSRSGYLRIVDGDGEDNFIPVSNISCIEAKQSMVLSRLQEGQRVGYY